MNNNRRWYGFNDLETVKSRLSEVKTKEDVLQLRTDIHLSGSNLIYFIQGESGVYCVDYVDEATYRHIFMTELAYSKYGDIHPTEGDALTVLE
jgi:hypothetical protein